MPPANHIADALALLAVVVPVIGCAVQGCALIFLTRFNTELMRENDEMRKLTWVERIGDSDASATDAVQTGSEPWE
jgi:hypothetical protein